MNRWVFVGALTVCVAAVACRRAEDSGAPGSAGTTSEPAHSVAEQNEILDRLQDLIRASDQATSPVTIALPAGGNAAGRVSHARVVAPERQPVAPVPADPLGSVAQAMPIGPAYPGGIDWAPGSSSELLVARRDGVWRVNADTGRRTRWLALPDEFVPRQVTAGPSNLVLLAQPGQAAVATWDPAGESSPTLSPDTFRLNYATWNTVGDSTARLPVIGIVEYLQLADPTDRIRLEASRWNPEDGTVNTYDGPPVNGLAWLGSAWEMGCWLAHRRQAGRIDPFPAPLLYWDSPRRAWVPLFPPGDWTDAGTRVARPRNPDTAARTGDFTAVWVRRLRPNWTAGRPWTRCVTHSPDTTTSAPDSHRFEDLPLSEINVEHVALSFDGRRVAYVPAKTRSTTETRSLYVADLAEAVAESRRTGLLDNDRQRREVRDTFLRHLRSAWVATVSRPAGASGSSTQPRDPTAANIQNERIEENVRGMDEAFVVAAESALALRADHTLASLAEIDERLDWLGGDLGEEPAAVAAMGVYFGETLRRATQAAWDVSSWPPNLDPTDPALSSSDNFLYTTHRPFLAARESLDKRLSLADTARDLTTHWQRPVYLVDLDHAAALKRIVRSSLEGLLGPGGGETLDLRTVRFPTDRIEAWMKVLPESDWVLLKLLDNDDIRAHPGAGWRLAAELARRHPESARAFGILGQALATEGWPGPARVGFLRAAEMDPLEPAYAVSAGLASYDDGDYAAALRWMRRAQLLDREGEWRDTIQETLKALQDWP